jgi:hypothetical protein
MHSSLSLEESSNVEDQVLGVSQLYCSFTQNLLGMCEYAMLHYPSVSQEEMFLEDLNVEHLAKCYEQCVDDPNCDYFGYNEDIPRCVLLRDLDRESLAARCSNEMEGMDAEQRASLEGTLVYMMNDEAFTLYDTEVAEEICTCKDGYEADVTNSSQCVPVGAASAPASALAPAPAPSADDRAAPLIAAAEQQIGSSVEQRASSGGANEASIAVLSALLGTGALILAARVTTRVVKSEKSIADRAQAISVLPRVSAAL